MAHVFGKGSFDVNLFAGIGMVEVDTPGVQGLARDSITWAAIGSVT